LNAPSVSVGICAYNEEQNIGSLLNTLIRDAHLDDIIVVASGCTDRTEQIVNHLEGSDRRIRLIAEPHRQGKAAAVNRITSVCRSEIVVFISADTLPTRGCLASLVQWFRDPTIGAVSATPIPLNPRKGFGNAGRIMWKVHELYLKKLMMKGVLAHVSGEMCAFRKNLMDLIPHDIINEDAYQAIQVVRQRYRIAADSRAIVHIRAPSTIRELVEQRRRVLAGHARVKERTGETPTVFATTWRKYPRDALSVLLALPREAGLSVFSWSIVLLICELVAYVLSRFDLRTKRKMETWPRISSTKQLFGDADG